MGMRTTVLRTHVFRDAHLTALLDAQNGTHVIAGSEPTISQRAAGANMSVDVSAFSYSLAGVQGSKSDTTNVAIDAADATKPRIDLLYVDSTGDLKILKGTAKVVIPTGESTWQKYEEPYPADFSGISGLVLAEILVPAGAASIIDSYIRNCGVVSVAGGSSFWTDVPGTPTRASNTQFTITDTSNANKYDKMFTKGTILKWDKSGFKTAMVISSSYSSNNVTINIVGDALEDGFSSMKYCIHRAWRFEWIVPGTLGTGTDVGRSHYTPCDLIKLSVDAFVKTAGTTNSTDIDINDDGSTIITTKPSIATGTTSSKNNACDSPTTVIAMDSVLTVDIDAVSTTPPIDLYVVLFTYPESWRYIS